MGVDEEGFWELDTAGVGLTSLVLNMGLVPDFEPTTGDETEGLTSVDFLLPNTATDEADDAVINCFIWVKEPVCKVRVTEPVVDDELADVVINCFVCEVRVIEAVVDDELVDK